MGIFTLTIQDIIMYGYSRSSSKNIDMEAVLPFILLPGLLLIATISFEVTIIVMVVIAMGALYVHSRPTQKNRSSFCFSWTVASGITMFMIFEIEMLGFLEITQYEHFIFLVLLACTCYFFYKMKAVADFELATGSSKGKEYSPVLTSDSHYCQICQIEVNERFFHSIWWDCCVLRPNYIYFLAGQIFAFATISFGSLLGLTTVCQPFILFGILLPRNCDDVYFDYVMTVCYVSCLYGIGYLFVIALVLFKQLLIYIPKYCEPQWRKLVTVLHV